MTRLQHDEVGAGRHLQDGCQSQGCLYVVAVVPLLLGICPDLRHSAVGHLWGICGGVPLDKPHWRAQERDAHLEDEGWLSVSGLTPAAESNALSVFA